MPDRNIDFGHYGATGELSSLAAARVLDNLAGGITSPVTTRRGLTARLRYMTRSEHARDLMASEGLNPSRETLSKWLDGTQHPKPSNLVLIDRTYRRMRRYNVARYLLQRLNAGGGTRVEIHPADDTFVQDRHRRRDKQMRKINIRNWDRIIQAWADGVWEKGNEKPLDNAWVDELRDALGSDWGAYEYCKSLGFNA
ncbi:transcriptional regulator [Streptomyces griseorubiginosus]|uniref:transcriptional regulator n=1 Tax=Streptomyces griseorubiginosus TaxID=67304 RepID=UPI0036E52CC8